MTTKNTVETCQRLPHAESLLPLHARVVEWQTRTFEGRMPKGLRVQVPPRSFYFAYEKRGSFDSHPVFRTHLGQPSRYVYHESGNVIETLQRKGDFKES